MNNWESGEHKFKSILVAGCTYLLLVLIMWLPFGPLNGMAYETAFPYMSETSSWVRGFIYPDPMRIHTNYFYQISYLLGELVGVGGSFLPYQVVYAALWWARGLLVFLILQRLLPRYLLLGFLAGGLVIVHASDNALEWVGQLNQFGFIFWMLLAFYMFVLAFQSSRMTRRVPFLVLAVFFEYMSLWSYESPLFMLLLAPFVLLIGNLKLWRRLLGMAIMWYIVSLTYIYQTISRYLGAGGQTYQESVLRKNWSLLSIMNDLVFNLSASLKFWDWASRVALVTPSPITITLTEQELFVLSGLAACVFVIGGIILISVQNRNPLNEPRLDNRVLWLVLTVGSALLVLSFPAYLLLDSADSLWRTQFLSGVGSALVTGSAISLVARLSSEEKIRTVTILAFGALVCFFGSSTAIKLGASNYRIWELHRQAIYQVIDVAPHLKTGTIVVLTNIPKDSDPFGANMWFDVALRLAYPGTKIAGIYFFTDGTPSPGNDMKLNDAKWIWSGPDFPPLLRQVSIDQTIVIDYDPQGNAKVESNMPEFLKLAEDVSRLYNPQSLVTPGTPPPRVLRRYGR